MTLTKPNVLIRKNVDSIIAFTEIILEINSLWHPGSSCPDIWYRGVKDARFDLLPGAYFREDCDELSLVLHFRSRSPALLSREPLDDWEWYYLMQHYGIPTRLLDWTESPLAALYFALEQDSPKSAPCVWVLDPYSLNRLSGEEYILFPYPDTELKYWLPDYCGSRASVHTFPEGARFKDNTKPLAIYPKRYNPRIVAQRGVFTVHGMEQTPINKLPLMDGSQSETRIAKIVFKASARGKLWDELWALGFSKAVIYPEPQSLADDLKRAYLSD
jgi:hypothetical protein